MHDTRLGHECEFEGVAFDPNLNALLLACKNVRTKGPLRDSLVIYRWKLPDGGGTGSPQLAVPLSEIIGANGWKGLHPSDITIDPFSGNYVLVAGEEKALIEITPAGEVVSLRPLPGSLEHTEGVAITPDSLLILSDEAGKARRHRALSLALRRPVPCPGPAFAGSSSSPCCRRSVRSVHAQAGRSPPRQPSPIPTAADSVEIVAGAKYQAGGLHRFLFGNGYRDLWTTPMRVPVLDLQTFGGGLRPLKIAAATRRSRCASSPPRGPSTSSGASTRPARLAAGLQGNRGRDGRPATRSAPTTRPAPWCAARLLEAGGRAPCHPEHSWSCPTTRRWAKFRAEFAGRSA